MLLTQAKAQTESRALRIFTAIGRLKPDVTIEQAGSELAAISADLSRAYPATNDGIVLEVRSLTDRIIGDVRTPLFVLLATVGLILLIACANVANLMLARTAAREREIAIRSALGAARRRLFGQLAVESLVLAIAGGLSGLLLAMWMTDLVPTLLASAAAAPKRSGSTASSCSSRSQSRSEPACSSVSPWCCRRAVASPRSGKADAASPRRASAEAPQRDRGGRGRPGDRRGHRRGTTGPQLRHADHPGSRIGPGPRAFLQHATRETPRRRGARPGGGRVDGSPSRRCRASRRQVPPPGCPRSPRNGAPASRSKAASSLLKRTERCSWRPRLACSRRGGRPC